jgi:hypothetical protein
MIETTYHTPNFEIAWPLHNIRIDAALLSLDKGSRTESPGRA